MFPNEFPVDARDACPAVYHLIFFVIVYLFQLGKFLAADFLHCGVPLLGKGHAGGTGVSGFLAAEAEFLLDATSAFFRGELRDFDGVDDHGVGVMGFGIHGIGGVVGLVGGFRVSFGDIISSFPLDLEGNGLLIPVVDGGGNGIHRHDAAYQGGWNSCREVSDQDIGVRDVGEGYVVLEGRDILCQRGGIRVVFRILLHMLDR